METKQVVIFGLAAIAAGGGLYALAYPWLTDNRAQLRQQSIYQPGGRAVVNPRETALRRGQVSDSLKELEKRQANLRNPPLTVRIEQAGLDWSPRQYRIISIVTALIAAVAVYVMMGSGIAALGALIVGGLFLPRMYLKRKTKRRQAAFIKEFPNAIDIIVRGIKTGLPLGDCFRIVAKEAQEPVKSEFRGIIEMQTVGMGLGDAAERLYTRLGLAEANFFSIVIAIQSKSGGNLSEALGNLANVLRQRQKMKGKIQAMSMEAKTSAWIIGSLPVCVGVMVYFASPEYISLLWTKNMGLILLGGSAFWMTMGILTMRKMINFDF